MAEICINPAEIQNGDMMAYLDGAADESVAKHLTRCPACRRRVQELAEWQAALTTTLYRHSCPSSERLLAHQHAELRGGERLAVAQHLRQCPHCAREMAALARGERSSLGDWLRTAVEVVETTLITPQIQAVPVRSIPEESRSTLQIYRTGDVEVILSLRPAHNHSSQQNLAGLVHSGGRVPETIAGAQVELYRDQGLIAIERVSARGQFVFEAVEPGDYALHLVWGSREIRLSGIRVQ